jgi:hypothetical protein
MRSPLLGGATFPSHAVLSQLVSPFFSLAHSTTFSLAQILALMMTLTLAFEQAMPPKRHGARTFKL